MTTLAIVGLVVLILAIILLGEPLYVLMGAVAVYCLLMGGVLDRFDILSTSIIGETRGLADNPVLLAVPFFVLAGALMTEGDIARRLIDFARALFGWVPGGLAIAAVCACIFFAAISGSSPVTVIAIGTIMYPALIKEKYPDRFSNGLVTSAGSLGILIPPSIPMIVYAIVDPTQFADPPGYTLGSGGGNTGVADLFLAGIGPGFLIGAVLAGYSFFVGLKHKVPTTRFDLRQVGVALREGFWALMLPLIILGGIYSGVFSPTQAAAVSVVYAFVVEFWIHKSLKLEALPRILSGSAVLMGTLLIIMALALGFNRYLELAQIPEAAVEMIKEMDLSLVSFLLIVNVLLLVVGCLMDILSAILILVPLLAVVGAQLGVHPLHLAIIFIVNLEIGYLTPPVGMNLFVSSTIFNKKLGEVIRAAVPFVGLMLVCLMVITYVPTVSLGLVSLLKGQPFVVSFPDPSARTPQEGGEGEGGGSELDELMNEANEEGGGAGGELDALMDEVEAEQGGEKTPAPAPKKPGSELEELMDEVEAEQGKP
jgi:C4-dicarboxylate transporter DctM subunit